MSVESLDFVPSAQRERTDYFYLRNVLQGALAKEWLRIHPEREEIEWFTTYHAAFKQLVPNSSEGSAVEAELLKLVAFLKQASPEDVSMKMAELQARLDKATPSVS